MRIPQVAIWAVLTSFLAGSAADAHGLFRRCRTCETPTGANAPGKQDARPAAPEKIAAPAAPFMLQIASSGLEGEVQKRLRDWAAKGVTPEKSATETGTKSIKITIEIDGQKFEGTLTLKGTGGKGPPVDPGAGDDDLAKALKAANDKVGAGVRSKGLEEAAILYRSLAANVRAKGITSIMGLLKTRDDFLKMRANAKQLSATNDVVDAHLKQKLAGIDNELNDTTRPMVAAVLEAIAKTLNDAR